MTEQYEQFIDELKVVCKKKGYHLKKIGVHKTASHNDLATYRVLINRNSKNKRTICLLAGIHGDEFSGPLATLEFLKKYRSKKEHPEIILFPNSNPYGIAVGKRRSSQNLDLNRHFCKNKLCKECDDLLKAILHKKIYFSATFHEDDLMQGTYIYAYNHNKQTPTIFYQLINKAKKYGEICTDSRIYKQKADAGLVTEPVSDGSFSERMKKEKVPYGICVEVPDKFNMEKRVKINVGIMNKIVSFCSKPIDDSNLV